MFVKNLMKNIVAIIYLFIYFCCNVDCNCNFLINYLLLKKIIVLQKKPDQDINYKYVSIVWTIPNME